MAGAESGIVDVWLNNVSPPSGFAKRNDLAFFLDQICNMDYLYFPQLAPTKNMLGGNSRNGGSRDDYELQFLDLVTNRRIEDRLERELLEDTCLECTEDTPHHCHRRGSWPNICRSNWAMSTSNISVRTGSRGCRPSRTSVTNTGPA